MPERRRVLRSGSGSGSGSEPAQLQQPQPLLHGVGEASWLAGGSGGGGYAIGGLVGQAPPNANEPPALINLSGLPTAEVDDFLRSLLNLHNTQQPAAQAMPQPQAHLSFRGLILSPTPSPLSLSAVCLAHTDIHCFLIVSLSSGCLYKNYN